MNSRYVGLALAVAGACIVTTMRGCPPGMIAISGVVAAATYVGLSVLFDDKIQAWMNRHSLDD